MTTLAAKKTNEAPQPANQPAEARPDGVEANADLMTRFSAFDKDYNNSLSKKEFDDALRAGAKPGMPFEALDKNSDQKLARGEVFEALRNTPMKSLKAGLQGLNELSKVDINELKAERLRNGPDEPLTKLELDVRSVNILKSMVNTRNRAAFFADAALGIGGGTDEHQFFAQVNDLTPKQVAQLIDHKGVESLQYFIDRDFDGKGYRDAMRPFLNSGHLGFIIEAIKNNPKWDEPLNRAMDQLKERLPEKFAELEKNNPGQLPVLRERIRKDPESLWSMMGILP